MLACGDTVDIKKPGHSVPHLWILVTDPNEDGLVVIVNVTSKRQDSDFTTTITAGEHPYVIHESVIYYNDATITSARDLESAIAAKIAVQCDRCSADLLARIQEGLCNSPFTTHKIRNFCRDAWGRDCDPPSLPVT